MTRPGELIAGRFELEAEIGAGGMGTVYRARDREAGGAVAVKLLRWDQADDVERFLREGAVLASLRHPGIVRHVAHGQADDGALFLAMEWIRGDTLAERLAGTGLDVAESVLVAHRAAEALAEAHANHIVHRDVKPSNLLFADGELGRLKVIDFGVARQVRDVKPLTRSGTTMGTPAYMAPEQTRGRKLLDARVDVFSLGCVLFECLTGQPAFSGENDLAVQTKILLSHPPPLRDLCPEAPKELEGLVACMLAKDPARRLADAAEVSAVLAIVRPPPSSPRRSTAALSNVATRLATPATRKEHLVYTVIAATKAILDGGLVEAEPDPNLAALGAKLAGEASAIEVLGDGSIVAQVEDESPASGAARAARLALALRDGLPGRHVVVAASSLADQAIDAATRVLATCALSAIFASLSKSGAADAVHLDDLTAARLDADFDVRRGPSGGASLHGLLR